MRDVQVTREGLDLFFKQRNQASRVVDFIGTIFPVRTKVSKKLVSADSHSNTQKYEHVYVIEVIPFSKGDLILPPKDSGRAPELMLVSQMSTIARLVSPTTLNRMDYTAAKFFSMPTQIKPVMTARNLTKFIVLDISLIRSSSSVGDIEQNAKERGGVLAEAEVL